MKLILASKSPFRRKALELLGLKYEVMPSDFDEKSLRDADPEKLSVKLAEAKAMEIGKREKAAIIVASDYFVVFNGRIYEKPTGIEEAKGMLRDFSGQRIDNVCSICVYNSKTGKVLSGVEHCYMQFRQLSGHEIEDYVSRYPVTTFAGAFDTDGSIRFSERIEGEPCFTFGLPVSRLILMLREMGLNV
jgi:septum formation protein